MTSTAGRIVDAWIQPVLIFHICRLVSVSCKSALGLLPEVERNYRKMHVACSEFD